MVALNESIKDRAVAAAKAIDRHLPVRAAYVFGSHTRGTADEWSDIDVAAFVDDFDSKDAFERVRVIVDVQKEVGFDVEPHLFSATKLDAADPASFAAEIMRTGVRIF